MRSFAKEATAARKDPVDIVLALLKELSVEVTAESVRESILSHPYYPSLLCISESLERWGLETLALEITASDLERLPCPFLAHCPSAGEDPYKMVKAVGEGKLVCVDGRGRTGTIPMDEFCGIWDGKVLVMETKEAAGDPDYRAQRQRAHWKMWRKVLAVVVMLLAMGGAVGRFLKSPGHGGWEDIYFVVVSVANVLGVAATVLLLGFEHGRGDKRIQRWCSLHDAMSCAAVLESRAARIRGGVSWSELGLLYFAGALGYGWGAAYGGVSLAPMVLSNFLASGYIIFSLVYQGFVVRKWCLFCLFIQALLLTEAVVAFAARQPSTTHGIFRLEDVWPFVVAYAVPAAGWVLIRPYWLQSMEADGMRRVLNRLKRNEGVFQSLHGQSDALRNDPWPVALVTGEENATRSVVLISSPFCGPCANAHVQLERLLETDRRWKVGFIFSIVGEDEQAAGVVGSFIEAAASGEEQLHSALREWYEGVKKSGGRWEGIPMHGRTPGAEARRRVAAMIEWCAKEGIRYTPMVFVDGRLMPEHYEIEDLRYL